ncbi:uncharacterized protein LOC105696426 isoform X2 [Orussus abietinus]|uniref:uncharacterized protein LOC105696426 isoform X2 n=1 Tax=Orussus abietinus TaxID=222816 RepID=UPI0006262B57|nr:uncharacterized protein LOC105696426 isoform X2 [Orussus abietinus]
MAGKSEQPSARSTPPCQNRGRQTVRDIHRSGVPVFRSGEHFAYAAKAGHDDAASTVHPAANIGIVADTMGYQSPQSETYTDDASPRVSCVDTGSGNGDGDGCDADFDAETESEVKRIDDDDDDARCRIAKTLDYSVGFEVPRDRGEAGRPYSVGNVKADRGDREKRLQGKDDGERTYALEFADQRQEVPINGYAAETERNSIDAFNGALLSCEPSLVSRVCPPRPRIPTDPGADCGVDVLTGVRGVGDNDGYGKRYLAGKDPVRAIETFPLVVPSGVPPDPRAGYRPIDDLASTENVGTKARPESPSGEVGFGSYRDDSRRNADLVLGGRCDSARSEYDGLSSPDILGPEQRDEQESGRNLCRSHDAMVNGSGAQQAARSVPRMAPQRAPLSTMRTTDFPATQRKPQPTVSTPPGWKRICTNDVIVYVSPSSTALGSLDQLKKYLTTPGTCKCGLECPFRPERIFNFDPKVTTRSWGADQERTQEMTKLCNHKRKSLLSGIVVNSAVPCTSSISTGSCTSHTLHEVADSPTSPSKVSKDGLSNKKKRKLGTAEGICSEISVPNNVTRERIPTDSAALQVHNSQSSSASQVWPIAITNLDIQQNNKHISQQVLNFPPQTQNRNRCLGRNSQRLGQHVTGTVMDNSPLTNKSISSRANVTAQQQQQLCQQQHFVQQNVSQQQHSLQEQLLHHQQVQHMQILLQQQPVRQQPPNVLSNQISYQRAAPYVNQLNQHSFHVMQQQHLNHQQNVNLQSQKYNLCLHEQRVSQEIDQQQLKGCTLQQPVESFDHRMNSSSSTSENCLQPRLQLNQRQGQHRTNENLIQNLSPEHYQIQPRCEQASQLCPPERYPNQVRPLNAASIVEPLKNGIQSVRDEDVVEKTVQPKVLLHGYEVQRHRINKGRHSGNKQDNMRGCSQHEVQYPSTNFEATKNSTLNLKLSHRHHPVVSRVEKNKNIVGTQSEKGSTKHSVGMHYDTRTSSWQNSRNNAASAPVTIQNVVCNTFDRVPPLHHHIPPAAVWVDEVARKKIKTGKVLSKRQRQNGIAETRNNVGTSVSPGEPCSDKNQTAVQGESTVSSSPSFLDDPSGYLAQQTALLNSTISRQTGSNTSQVLASNNFGASQEANSGPLPGNAYFLQSKAAGVDHFVGTTACSLLNANVTSPVEVHSSAVPVTEASTGDREEKSFGGCISSADPQSCLQDLYKHGRCPRSTYGDDCGTFDDGSSVNRQVDSRPIQGGTVSTSHESPIGAKSPGNPDAPSDATPKNHAPVHRASRNSSQAPKQLPYANQGQRSALDHREERAFSPNACSLATSSETAAGQASVLDGYRMARASTTLGSGTSAVITTMASGHTVSSNTITSVLAGRANTATVSINTPSVIPNPAISNMPSSKLTQSTCSNGTPASLVMPNLSPSPVSPEQMSTVGVSKSPLEMVQSVVSSIQVPPDNARPAQPSQLRLQQHSQSNVQVQNILSSGGILKHSPGSSLPSGHILVSSGGQLIMANTGSGLNGVMELSPAKMMSNSSSVPPMVTSASGPVGQVIPAVGVAQQVLGQPTVLVNAIQAPMLIQPGVMAVDGIGQNVPIPHLTVATGNVLHNASSILEQDVSRNLGPNQGMLNKQPVLMSPESSSSRKKPCKKRKGNSQTVLHIASSQQNAGVLVQSQANFSQQNFQAQNMDGPMLQALTIVPGKAGAPAQLVINGQPASNSAQFNSQQIIANQHPPQHINLLQPVNLLNNPAGMVSNFPTIQQFIVPGLGSMVMSADGTATLLQDTGNMGMQLQIQNVNGQNVLTPVQSHGGIFGPSQNILAAGPAGMVIRTSQTSNGKLLQQHNSGAQFLSSNSGQFLVNGTTSFGNQLSPILANVSPSHQLTFNASPVRSSNVQGQQDFIQMNGQTLMVPCATAQNMIVSSASNQQSTTFVHQNTTIVQQQTTMLSNNQIQGFHSTADGDGGGMDRNRSYVLGPGGTIQEKSSRSPKSTAGSPPTERSPEQRPYVLDKSGQRASQYGPSMVKHSVSTQTAGNQTSAAQSTGSRQASPPDTTTHSPGSSPADTTTPGAASPAPLRHRSSSTPMVHCISSSEPDAADAQSTEDWPVPDAFAKEISLGRADAHERAYVESTVTTGIQIYSTNTLVQSERVVNTLGCNDKDPALGRGIKRKLASVRFVHSNLLGNKNGNEAATNE